MANSTLPHFCSLLLLLLLLPLLPTVFTYTKDDCNIRLDSPLIAQQGTGPWKSRSGEFAFGFYPIQSDKILNQFLFAVWFDKIKDKTIVWSANGNNPAPQGSALKLSSNKEFVLNDPLGKELWKPQRNGSKSSCFVMLDKGNLVILDEQYNPMWESFKEPTDTILPGQTLYRNTTLRSRQSDTNYSKGRFQLAFQYDGNLVLYSLSMPSEIRGKAYFSSWTVNLATQLNFTEAGYMYVQNAILTNWFNVFKKNPGSSETFYHMARIDHDGVFRLYKHLRKEDTTSGGSSPASWTEVNGIPDNICDAFVNYANGGGFCGPNSICTTKSGSSHASCSCPVGFSALDQSDYRTGCKPNFTVSNCHNGREANKEFDFVKLTNTDWPVSDNNFLKGSAVDEATCRQLCLNDCLCVVAVYDDKDKSCWKTKYPLSNGRKNTNITRISLIKVPKGHGSDMKGKSDKKGEPMVVILAVLLSSSAFLNILFFIASFVASFYIYHKKVNMPWNIDSTLAINVRSYTYKELEQATMGFKQILGKGAFGTVYKGVLASDSKIFVAVKKLDKVVEEGEKEFKTEVNVIGQTHHKNLVRLLGYCDEGQHRLLVYEYMSNGSLSSFLFGISKPHWNQRVKIASGIAKGLMYLHEECSTQIIHCDIKPQNILLDEYFTPRIADFGLAKLLLMEQSRAALTTIRGTIGYFAPEWFTQASISVKVDVFSFGVMLLEIICCKSCIAFAREEEEAFIVWAYVCYKDKRLDKLIENDEEARNDMKRLERLVIVALWCIQGDPSLRPSMKKVTQMLEGVIEVSVPPSPPLYTSSSSSKSSSFFDFSLSSVSVPHL
ncbi:G-type lectin S-receptor-like serine/threonine-protein kinase LECRK3 [Castanea sativa]|uniref:G-type lectin S-receptor-like serine/threonine-protein kinase LECRK3 n=1 Tax=Castanea sativa TaxID=21020 RepID=UPI003F654650